MKTQTLLLGEYDSSTFSIYIISNNATASTTDYLSIEDLYRLFFYHSQDDIIPLIYTLYQRHPQDFYHDHRDNCYMAKHHVLTLAQSLQLLALAEFCTLTHDELINRIADPLFAITNALMLRPVTPKRMAIDLDWFPLASSPSFFSSFLNTASTRFLTSARPITTSRRRSPPPAYYSQNEQHNWARHFLPLHNIGIDCTLRAQKQQHAIIECRQRLSVYRQSQAKEPGLKKSSISSCSSSSSTSSSSSSTSSSSSLSSSSLSPPIKNLKSSSTSSLSSSSSSPEYYHQYQAQIYQQRKRKTSSPPTPLSSHKHSGVIELSLKDLHYHHHSTQQQPSSTSMVHNNSYREHKKLKSSYSNLDLLATQATKLKGLPLSPEISPPPRLMLSLPPISSNSAPTTATGTTTSDPSSFHFIQSISLPPIRNVFSDI